jgi:hypothetical protein
MPWESVARGRLGVKSFLTKVALEVSRVGRG